MPILAMVKAKRQATLAYKFNPSSYTHSGFIAVNVAEIALVAVGADQPDTMPAPSIEMSD